MRGTLRSCRRVHSATVWRPFQHQTTLSPLTPGLGADGATGCVSLPLSVSTSPRSDNNSIYIRPLPKFLLISQSSVDLISSLSQLIGMASDIQRSLPMKKCASRRLRDASGTARLTSNIQSSRPARVSKRRALSRRKSLCTILNNFA